MRLLAVTFILISLAFSNLHAGDVLILPNGNQYEGKVVKLKGCDVIFKSNGHRYAIPAADIHSIHFEDENMKFSLIILNYPVMKVLINAWREQKMPECFMERKERMSP